MEEDKYILQFGSLAGWPFTIAKELRRLGANSKNIIYVDKEWKDLNRQLKFDKALYHQKDNLLLKVSKLLKYLNTAHKEVNLIHYHSSNLFFRELHWLYEGPLYSRHNIPMVITFGGGDVRNIRHANKVNKHFWMKNSIRTLYRDLRTWIRFKSWKRYLKYAIVDPEFYEYVKPYFEKVYLFRQPINLEKIQCQIPDKMQKKPIVLHVPTEPVVKATDLIVEACERLQAEGYQFEFILKRQITQEELYMEISKCDIYVDELRCGAHGVTAVEAMAAGKPTLVYIRDDLVDAYPKELPLVNTNPETIYENLKALITDSELRHNIGKESRAYVEKYHDVRVVANELLQIYQDIMQKSLR